MANEKVLKRWKDPLGRSVVLTLERWKAHILKRHPDMALLLDQVGKAIEAPEYILKQGTDRVYLGELSETRHIMIAVRLTDREGFVKTAYTYGDRDTKGEIEWVKI